MIKRLAELEQSHQETVYHLNEQLKANDQKYQQEVLHYRTLIENQRQKSLVEIDQLKTTHETLREKQIKAEAELKNQLHLNKELSEQKKALELDTKVFQQQQQNLEIQYATIRAEAKQKDSTIEDLQKQQQALQLRLEEANEKIGQLKGAKNK